MEIATKTVTLHYCGRCVQFQWNNAMGPDRVEGTIITQFDLPGRVYLALKPHGGEVVLGAVYELVEDNGQYDLLAKARGPHRKLFLPTGSEGSSGDELVDIYRYAKAKDEELRKKNGLE
eukprot:TRINITY_DN10378_c1_g1_i1.p2 TRINITY_DN10378_c1_g1~~TRINITY_DN10378_c1_g1_i1.p2  ORF type:complete len:133 (-),score=25.37 TRINITY_DN10378_c1_g1_i1:311-667(-)